MFDFFDKNTRLSAAVLAFAMVSGGCASSGETVAAIDCPTPTLNAEEYIIGTGDTLQVVVWRNEELSTTIPVRPDGKISTPLIDDIVAAGRTPSQLAAEMEKVLSEYIRTPDVSVIVSSQGASNQIHVVGEVVTPEAISFHAGLRVLDVVIGSGGLGEFAAGNRAHIVREMPNGSVRCRVRLKDLLAGDMTQNILVYAGDVLVIPESRF